MENETHYMSGRQAIKELVDTCSQGGDFLLNVGPDEAGNLPDLQVKCLEYMAAYMDVNAEAIHGSDVVDPSLAEPVGNDKSVEWVRWTAKGRKIYAFVDHDTQLEADWKRVDLASARLLGGERVDVSETIKVGDLDVLLPACIEFTLL